MGGSRKRKLTEADRQAAERVRALWKEYQGKHPGITQDVAAERAGMGQSAFSQFLLGKVPMRVSPTLKLAKLFGVPPTAIREDLADIAYSLSNKTTALQAREPGVTGLSGEALEIAAVYQRLTPQTKDIIREHIFIYSLIDRKYPWLRRGRPKGESYDQFERRAEHSITVKLAFDAQKKAKQRS